MLAQAVEIWRQFRRLLWAMKELPLWTCLSRLTSMRVHWSVSVLPPNPGDVRLPLRIVDSLQRQMSDVEVRGLVGNDDESALHILRNDAVGAYAAGHQPTSLTQSATFLKLWLLADRLMPAVDSARWMHRRVLDSTAKASDDEPVTCCRTFLDHCETFLAVQRALVLRDVVARIMAGILASMVTLGLLTSAHLFYVFQGRSSYLTLDVLALGVTAVVAGITYNFLPFMTLPLYVALEKIDRRLIEAANDLYASRSTAFWRITFVLSLPGVFAGSLLVFIPAMGDFITAEVIGAGNPQVFMVGNIIQRKFLDSLDYPSASALAFVLVAAVMILIAIYARVVGSERLTS
jgi:ABC-type spermidine/putrescine transport system permease subunit II